MTMREKRGDVMQRSTNYRKRAEECVQLAQTVRTPEQRIMLLHIAETWLRLADDSTRGWTEEATAAVN
jgi:hypothetical protein